MTKSLPSTFRALLIASTICVVLFFGAELCSRLLFQFYPMPHSYQAIRNPNFLRGWPAYTEPRQRSSKDRLIVLMANSQGFMPEYRKPMPYARLLQNKLQKMAPKHRWIVANWSRHGGSAADFIVLAARAAQHKPDAVIFSACMDTFTKANAFWKLSRFTSDVRELATLPSIRQALPASFLKRQVDFHPMSWLTARLKLIQWGRRFFEYRSYRWTWGSFGLSKTALHHSAFYKLKTPTWKSKHSEQLSGWVSALDQKSSNIPLFLVDMPVCKKVWTKKSQQYVNSFSQQSRKLFWSRKHTQVWDATDVIACQKFNATTHLRPAGHQQFAKHLAQKLSPHLKYIATWQTQSKQKGD